MHSSLWAFAVLILGTPALAIAVSHTLAWEQETPTTRYVLTITPDGQPAQIQTITAQSGAACQGVPDRSETTYCTQLACPTSGLFTVGLQAIYPQATSSAAELHMGCLGEATACTCTTASAGTPPSTSSSPTQEPAPTTQAPAATSTQATAMPTNAPPSTATATLDPITTSGSNLVLAWHQLRETGQIPHRFLLAYTKEDLSSLMLYAVPVHDATACQQVSTHSADLWCARLACPGVGTWQFTVQADYGTQVAGASNTQSCTITSTQSACQCSGSQTTTGTTVMDPTPEPAAATQHTTPSDLTALLAELRALKQELIALKEAYQRALDHVQSQTRTADPDVSQTGYTQSNILSKTASSIDKESTSHANDQPVPESAASVAPHPRARQ